jgi:hypothetical protein
MALSLYEQHRRGTSRKFDSSMLRGIREGAPLFYGRVIARNSQARNGSNG